MRKILGILNIIAGILIVALVGMLWTTGNLKDFESMVFLGFSIVLAGTSFSSGILVLKARVWVLAIINLILAGFVLSFILFVILYELFPS